MELIESQIEEIKQVIGTLQDAANYLEGAGKEGVAESVDCGIVVLRQAADTIESLQADKAKLEMKINKMINVIGELIPEILDLEECDKLIAGLKRHTPQTPRGEQ